MWGVLIMRVFFVWLCLVSVCAIADPKFIRWTGQDDPNADFIHVLKVIQQKTGITLSPSDFMLLEDRSLATSHFTMMQQMTGGLPIKSQSVRIWKRKQSGALIQMEALVDTGPVTDRWGVNQIRHSVSSADTLAMVRKVVANHPDDSSIREVSWQDLWNRGEIVREVKVKARRGYHYITVGLAARRVTVSRYEEFPQADGEFSVPVRVYPIYEEVEGELGVTLPRVDSELRYLSSVVPGVTEDPYASLKMKRYLETMLDPILGLTEEGQKKGYWTMAHIKAQARELLSAVPLVANSFQGRGVILEGRYATVNIHPEAAKAFPNLSFKPAMSGQLFPVWRPTPETSLVWEMVPSTALLGKPLMTEGEAWERPARRLPDHDPLTYINDGFDELQVYWSITRLFESLRGMGFVDPDFSTRPFHAYLYDPSIVYRNNAYYTDDTINFTTYTAENPNFARDNTTIWHELGHGVMDRLMGDHIQLADTGGLSEGMADFTALLVSTDVVGDNPFPGKDKLRIFNKTGFNLTNEVHDDGEAYGGAMSDLLHKAQARFGRSGLVKVTDLTMEAMRLGRNHPGLTASDWFERMLFADELGSAVRAPRELGDFILESLNGRNFVFSGKFASFELKNGSDEVTSTSLGSRGKPIPLKLKAAQTASFPLGVRLASSPAYPFRYPVKVTVEFRRGPIQGAVHWVGEEKNPWSFTLASENDTVSVPVTVTGICDEVNRPDGSCVDYISVQIWNDQQTDKPVGKKRFYVRVFPQQ